ncbi:MAG: hypothetical protein WCV63_11150 [Negativicutes bacterium]|jgi:uncharacterized alkaline shock family protein YloU
MRVVALIGTSGTGKSHRAIKLAHREGLNAVIDDGLLISEGKILAGCSAKKETNKMKAVRRAIFDDAEHLSEVRNKIKVTPSISGILVLGTSENMINRIVAALELPAVEKWIDIENETTKQDRIYAYNRRFIYGEHVVPLPYVELQETWADIFDRTFQVVFGLGKRKKHYEKTIVKTKFSYLGKITIADVVLVEIVKRLLLDETCVTGTSDVKIYSSKDDDDKTFVDICIHVTAYADCELLLKIKLLQEYIKDNLEAMTSMYIRRVNVEIFDIKKNSGISNWHNR